METSPSNPLNHLSQDPSVKGFLEMDPRFQRRSLLRLRSEGTQLLETLKMPEERKSYFLHQLANCHDIQNLMDLITQVNEAQLSQRELDLLVIGLSPEGFCLQKESFTAVDHWS